MDKNSANTSCNVQSDDVNYLYLEVNGWYVNGIIYTNFDRALGARKSPDDLVLQLYKKVWNPYATNSD